MPGGLCNGTDRENVKTMFTLGAPALAAFVIVGCSGMSTEDPAEAYADLVKAASEKNYGYLYDALDGEMRQGFDSLIALSYRSRASMSGEEKAFWDTTGTKAPREAFMAVMARDPMYTASLTGAYEVVKADTIVVLSIERNGTGELRYFTPEDGKLKVTSAPIASQGDMPTGHPGMGSPHGGEMPAPDDSIHGGGGMPAPAPGPDTGR